MHGGRNLAAVSTTLDYIVAGDNMSPRSPGKPRSWVGVKIISEEEFIAMVGGAGVFPGGKRDGSRQRNNGKYRRQEIWRPGQRREGGDGEPVQQGEFVLSPAEKEYA